MKTCKPPPLTVEPGRFDQWDVDINSKAGGFPKPWIMISNHWLTSDQARKAAEWLNLAADWADEQKPPKE